MASEKDNGRMRAVEERIASVLDDVSDNAAGATLAFGNDDESAPVLALPELERSHSASAPNEDANDDGLLSVESAEEEDAQLMHMDEDGELQRDVLLPRGVSRAALLRQAGERAFWLLVALVASSVGTGILHANEGLLEREVSLAPYIPMLMSLGGATGSQTTLLFLEKHLTAMQRISQNSGNRLSRDVFAQLWFLFRPFAISQLWTGAGVGVVLGVAAGLWSLLLERQIGVFIVVSFSQFFICIMSVICGMGVPIVFLQLGYDPALMSIPMLTTLCDVLSLSVYFILAHIVFGAF